jgi:hypothetical protein
MSFYRKAHEFVANKRRSELISFLLFPYQSEETAVGGGSGTGAEHSSKPGLV